ncbi:MAG: tRNA-dihydrouridine synthase family protein [Bdellovibrionota bacterium]
MSSQNEIIINKQKVNFPLCWAPMVGLSHLALRRVLRSYLPEGAIIPWPTEMLNSRKIPKEDLNKTPETLRGDEETQMVPQILGNEEKNIADSVKRLELEWGAGAIDINMGCPVQKALKHNYGVALMGDSNYAAEVVRMTVRNTKLPVSVKLRAVEQCEENKEKLIEFVQGLQAAGASWICLHPRTAEQKRRGRADWSQIQWLKKNLDIPVIGNGDIQSVEDVFQMKQETNCDLAMSGRALAARPWMFWQVGEKLGMPAPKGRQGFAPKTGEEEGVEYGHVLLQFIDECELIFSADLALRKVRFYIRTTHVWLVFGHSLVGLAHKAQNLDQLRVLVREFFEMPQVMVQRTELRQ